MSLEGAILGMGNPLLDISIEVNDNSLLEKYGLSLNNAILAEEKHKPLYKEMVENFPVMYIAGGATQNSIRVAQWMLPAGTTGYMGAVGCDEFGAQLEASATKEGVHVHYMKNPDVPTGTCAVIVHNNERSLVANLSAANTFNVSHLSTEEAKRMIERAKVIYMAGFFLTVSVESFVHAGKHAVANNQIICMNLSAQFIVEFFGDQLAAALPYADFVFGNESEAAKYGEIHGINGDDLHAVALHIAGLPKASGTRCRTVVFTQGPKCVIVAQNGVVQEFPVPELAKELIIDTNGAGDAFVGGFLARLVEGKSIEECVRSGNYASRIVIQYSGCTFPKNCDYI